MNNIVVKLHRFPTQDIILFNSHTRRDRLKKCDMLAIADALLIHPSNIIDKL